MCVEDAARGQSPLRTEGPEYSLGAIRVQSRLCLSVGAVFTSVADSRMTTPTCESHDTLRAVLFFLYSALYSARLTS